MKSMGIINFGQRGDKVMLMGKSTQVLNNVNNLEY